jgi:hypothetical protein
MRMAVQLLRAGRIEAASARKRCRCSTASSSSCSPTVEDVGDLMQRRPAPALQAAPQDANLLLDIVCGRGALVRELGTRKLTLRCEPCAPKLAVAHDPGAAGGLAGIPAAAHGRACRPGGELVLGCARTDGVTLQPGGRRRDAGAGPGTAVPAGHRRRRRRAGLRSLLMREVLRAARWSCAATATARCAALSPARSLNSARSAAALWSARSFGRRPALPTPRIGSPDMNNSTRSCSPSPFPLRSPPATAPRATRPRPKPQGARPPPNAAAEAAAADASAAAANAGDAVADAADATGDAAAPPPPQAANEAAAAGHEPAPK